MSPMIEGTIEAVDQTSIIKAKYRMNPLMRALLVYLLVFGVVLTFLCGFLIAQKHGHLSIADDIVTPIAICAAWLLGWPLFLHTVDRSFAPDKTHLRDTLMKVANPNYQAFDK